MNILLIGNLGSGKTTIANELIKKEFCNNDMYYAIDDLRRKHNQDRTQENEDKIWRRLLLTVSKQTKDNRIFEFSGFGQQVDNFAASIINSQSQWLVVKLNCEDTKSLKRLETRVWDIPLPKNWTKFEKKPDLESIQYGTNKLKDTYKKLFKVCNKQLTIDTTNKTVEQIVQQIIEKLL